MRVIVTGGAGFIGSALVRHLVLEKGCEVLNVDAHGALSDKTGHAQIYEVTL